MTTRRLPLVLAVAAALGAVGFAGRATLTGTSPVTTPGAAATLAPVPTGGDAWFCPGPPDAKSLADSRVTITNLGSTPAPVIVTVLSDKGKDAHRTMVIAPDSVVTERRRDLGPAGAITVETFGARVVVEEGLDGRWFDSNSCATRSADVWYFAAGTTVHGVEQWLVVENPYATDAKIDVTLRTSGGVDRALLRGLDISRRSREVIAIHEKAPIADRVSVEVRASAGQVVAAQMLRFGPGSGDIGGAWSLGVPRAGDRWTFPGGRTESGTRRWVAIANVSAADARVDVAALTDADQVIPPSSVTVAVDDVAWVQIGGCASKGQERCVAVPDGRRYSLDVRSDEGVAIVAQTIQRGTGGVASEFGLLEPARSWAFARSRVDGARGTTLSFVDPVAAPARIDVSLVNGGRVTRPPELQGLEVAPGRRLTVRLIGGKHPSTIDSAVIVTANVPVFVDRTIVTAGEASASLGVVLG